MESTPYHVRRYRRVIRKQERIPHVVKTIVYNECLRKILYGGFQGMYVGPNRVLHTNGPILTTRPIPYTNAGPRSAVGRAPYS